MITERGQIKILDFGIARILKRFNGTFQLQTMSQHLGTLSYMPPECFDEEDKITRAVDVWAYILILHEMLTRRPPWQSLKPEAILKILCTKSRAPDFQVSVKGDFKELF